MTGPKPKPSRETPPEDRVPLREKTALGLGFVTSLGSHNVMHVIANSVYNVTMGMSPALISVVLFLQRIWDAVLDPFVGQFSDNFRSRFGRRRPLLAMAVVPLAIFFAALWLFPRGAGEGELFAYVLLWSILFYSARSFYSVPLVGLQVEATPDYHERTRLTGFTQIFFFFFAIMPNWLFAWVQGPMFPDTVTGVHTMGILLGALFLITGLVPVFLTRERLYGRVASGQAKTSLRENLRTVLANQPFVLILTVQFVFSFGYNVVGILGMYATYYYVYGGDIRHGAVMMGWAGTLFQLAAVCSVFIYQRLSRSLGKKQTLQVAATVLMVGSAAKLVLFQPSHPWLVLLIWAANGVGTTGVAVLALSMLADAADYEELQTGARREALYGSVLSLCEKLGYSLGALLSGFILVGIGFDVHLGGGQASQTLLLMRILYAGLPFAGGLATALIIRRYPLTEERAYAIKDELARRRASAA